jgi:hypothetical protein
MTKVRDMIGDYADPRGSSGWSVPVELAEATAQEMRELLDTIYKFNCVLDQDVHIAAWEYLNAMERAAWTKVVQARGRSC